MQTLASVPAESFTIGSFHPGILLDALKLPPPTEPLATVLEPRYVCAVPGRLSKLDRQAMALRKSSGVTNKEQFQSSGKRDTSQNSRVWLELQITS